MKAETKLILENQIEIMEFLLYPNSPEKLIKQRNKTSEALTPPTNDLKEKRAEAIKVEGHDRIMRGLNKLKNVKKELF